MTLRVEAVYNNGQLQLLEEVDLQNGQKVNLVIQIQQVVGYCPKSLLRIGAKFECLFS